MKQVQVRGLKIGEGIPKICAPVVGVTKEEILESARMAVNTFADFAEWRADWYEDIFNDKCMSEMLEALRNILACMPLLFTFRTRREGGERETAKEQYAAINRKAASSGLVDLIDVEMFSGDEVVKEIIAWAHECNVKVIVSNHDFDKTPEKGEIVARLCKMQELGADICKIAVMPRERRDVLTLLAATEEMVREYADRPVITMSMAGQGLPSRLCGEIFGSAVTFGAVGKASAPGQIKLEKLRAILEILHENM